jgi:hypothetical protein
MFGRVDLRAASGEGLAARRLRRARDALSEMSAQRTARAAERLALDRLDAPMVGIAWGPIQKAAMVEKRVALMAARFSMQWAMPLEPGLPTHVSLVDHARDHQEWHAEGADETDALAALWTAMASDAPREALSYAAAAITRRTGRPWPPESGANPGAS